MSPLTSSSSAITSNVPHSPQRYRLLSGVTVIGGGAEVTYPMLGGRMTRSRMVRHYDSVSIGKGWHKNARTGRWRCNALGNICALQIARIIGFLGRRFWLDPDFFRGNLAHGIVGNKDGVNNRRRSRHGGRGRRQGDEDAGEQRLIHGFPYHPKLLTAPRLRPSWPELMPDTAPARH